jgi:hypothetical protein
MTHSDCEALLGVIRQFLSWRGHTQEDLSDLFDLLGLLELAEKQAFWAWLGANAPNVRRWLIASSDRSAA